MKQNAMRMSCTRIVRPCLVSLSACVLLLFTGKAAAQTKTWIQPTSDELLMTSEPKAPGAPAILLSYEEHGTADSAEVWIHERIKILTEGGLSEGTIHLPEKVVSNDDVPETVLARTIHRDGSVVEFHGTPQNSTVREGESSGGHVISMPAVEVGSILEFICHFRSVNTLMTHLIGLYEPVWHVQRPLFVHEAKFSLVVPKFDDSDTVRWVAMLPQKTAIKRVKENISLTLQDVPAAIDEEMMPPADTVLYNVRFFYYSKSRDHFWGEIGDRVDQAWFNYYTPRKVVNNAVAKLISPSDTDEVKLHKLYVAVTGLENTDLTRARYEKEDRKEGFRKAENSDDVWLQKRGSSDQLTLLFVAMARSAGYAAYPMAVTSRNYTTFNQDVLSWRQLDDMVAIVNVKGKDVFFDPGTRTCAFARMAPWHANVIGVSSEGKLIKVRYTPQDAFGTALRQRVADVKVDAEGSVTGKLQVGWTGNAGLSYRLEGFRDDQAAVEKSLKKAVEGYVPEGVEIKLEKLTGLGEEGMPLVATFSISGKLGLMTAKRMVLPAEFFESRSSAIFVPEKRTLPIAFPEMRQAQDVVTLHLPAGIKVESLPANQLLHLAGDTLYQATTTTTGKEEDGLTVRLERTFALKRIDYKVADYTNLRQYFGQVTAADHEQLVLSRKPSETAALAQ